MDCIQIIPTDQVVVSTRALRKGEVITVSTGDITVSEDIPPCHKVVVKPIKKGDQVLKYGCPFGVATEDIAVGRWVHTHNVKSMLEEAVSYSYEPQSSPAGHDSGDNTKSFEGYLRKDGQAGIRNFIFVIPSVSCANGPAKAITDQANQLFTASANFDGFIVLPHTYGCSQSGDDLLNLQKILTGLALNPNAGGVLFVSLGCEVNAVPTFKPLLADADPRGIKYLIMQNETDEIAAGVTLCKDLHDYVTEFQRQPLPLSKLVLGLNCGGSDGLSGVTANPLVGDMSDLAIADGASVVMTEVPEMFGAEQFLMNRAQDREVYDSIVKLINDYKRYFESHGETAHGNLTQGNQAGGLTTLEEKSLGCIQKGGSSAVTDVLFSGEHLRRAGLALVNGPGNDFIGITSQIVAGCNLIVFTTGRGTPGGFAAPTFRISSNTALYEQKKHWIDFNAGGLLEGEDRKKMAAALYEAIMETANGVYRTRNEVNKYYEIGILKQGITL